MAERDWLSFLPRTLRLRFEGLGSYVNSVIEDARLEDELHKEDVEVIHLLSFLRTLDDLFREGTEAATRAVDAFQAIGIANFSIGSETFAGRNDAVMRGENLAVALRTVVREALPLDQFASAQIYGELPLRSFVLQLARKLADDRKRNLG
jgi:hypothetical protein